MIEKLIATYSERQQKTLDYRNEWKTVTKPFLKATLNTYISKYPLDWGIEENYSVEHGETISLAFKTRPSGLHDKIQMKNVMKLGGSLNFIQLFNGEIQVIVKFPQIEGIYKKNPEFKQLDIARPEELDAQKLEEFIVSFLRDMIDFEVVERKTIGFYNVH